MTDRPTPETDAVLARLVKKLERERDEARELLASEKITRNHIIKRSVEVEKERDEAREERDKLKQLLSADAENVDAYLGVCIERDEAREHLSAAKHFLNKYIAERDEARDALRAVLELANDIPDESLDDWKIRFHKVLEEAK
jgi:hypothetical protein